MQQDGKVDKKNKNVKRDEGEKSGGAEEVSLWEKLQLLSPAHHPLL